MTHPRRRRIPVLVGTVERLVARDVTAGTQQLLVRLPLQRRGGVALQPWRLAGYDNTSEEDAARDSTATGVVADRPFARRIMPASGAFGTSSPPMLASRQRDHNRLNCESFNACSSR